MAFPLPLLGLVSEGSWGRQCLGYFHAFTAASGSLPWDLRLRLSLGNMGFDLPFFCHGGARYLGEYFLARLGIRMCAISFHLQAVRVDYTTRTARNSIIFASLQYSLVLFHSLLILEFELRSKFLRTWPWGCSKNDLLRELLVQCNCCLNVCCDLQKFGHAGCVGVNLLQPKILVRVWERWDRRWLINLWIIVGGLAG